MHPLVELAKKAVEEFVEHGRRLPVPENILLEFLKPAAVFVCLKKSGQLRGCIGTLTPKQSSVADEVIENAINACSKDRRFPAVEPEELREISYTVDILEPSEPVAGPEDLDPKRFGVIVTKGNARGLLLPDIEGVDTAEEQLAIAKSKAGIDTSDTDVEVEVHRFSVRRYG